MPASTCAACVHDSSASYTAATDSRMTDTCGRRGARREDYRSTALQRAARRARRGAVAHTHAPAPRTTPLAAESFPAQRRRRPAQLRRGRRVRLPWPVRGWRAHAALQQPDTQHVSCAPDAHAPTAARQASAHLEHVGRQAPYFCGKQAQQLARDNQRVAVRQHCSGSERRVRPQARGARPRWARTVLDKRLAAVRRVSGQRGGQRLRVLLDLQLLIRQRWGDEALQRRGASSSLPCTWGLTCYGLQRRRHRDGARVRQQRPRCP